MDGETIPLNEFVTLQRGHDLPNKDRVAGNIPVVASTGVVGFHNEAKAKAPGVVIGRSGSIGGGQYVTQNYWPLNTTLWVKDFKGHDPRFVYYLMRNIDFTSFNVGSGVPTLNRNHLSSIGVKDLGLSTERAISNVLGMLDDKIQLNQQINQSLEQMAQAIFKSWFVDFEPVKAKVAALAAGGSEEDVLLAAMQAISGKDADQLATMQTDHPEQYAELRATAELFPSAMQESELGEIPEGWNLGYLKEFIDFNPRRLLKKGSIAPYLDMKNVPTSGHLAQDVINREMGSGTKFINGDTLLARITPCLENGKTAFVDFLEDGQTGWGSTEYIVMRPKSPYPESLGYFIARDEVFRQFAVQSMTGTSGRQRANANALGELPWLLYPEALVHKFDLVAGAYLRLAKSNGEENKTLSQLRDSLLPKLLSGELNVDAGEKSQGKVEYDRAHDLAALIEKIESDLPPKSYFMVRERPPREFENIRAIGFMTKVTGSMGEGGGEYLKLPTFLRKLRQNPILEKVFATAVDGVTGIPLFMDGVTAILNKYLGKKIKFDQKTAIVLLAFPKEVVRTTSELLNKSYELSKSAGLEPIDEDQLQRSLSWLQSHRLIYPLNDKHQEWRLVDKFRHEIDNWG